VQLGPRAGHERSEADVFRISDDVGQLQLQQGYIQSQSSVCMRSLSHHATHSTYRHSSCSDIGSLHAASAALPLDPCATTNCFLQVSAPARSRSNFGILTHIEQVSATSFKAASTAVCATVKVQPTLSVTNSLPFATVMTVLEVWAAPPNARGQEQPAVDRDPSARGAARGASLEVPEQAHMSTLKLTSVTAERWTAGLPGDELLQELLLASGSALHGQVRPHISPFARPLLDTWC
jgi:hypothetical protein